MAVRRVTGLRLRHRVLRTSVVRYRHRGSGRAVTLVATVHIGEQAYYERLHALVMRLEEAGAAVHYEQIQSAGEEEWAAASEAERAVRPGLWTSRNRKARAACRYLGWVPQSLALAARASWRNVDLTDLELIRRIGPQVLREKQWAAAQASRADEDFDRLMGAAMSIVIWLTSHDPFGILDRLGRRATFGQPAVSDERNRMALAALPGDGDAVLLWGAAHLRGLAAGLRGLGYRRESAEWVTVGTVPALWASIRAFIAARRSQ